MARYNKIDLGPAIENCPQIEEGISAVAVTPGSITRFDAGAVVLASAADAVQGNQLYVADHQWCAGRDVDADTPAGETVLNHVPLNRKRYAALLLAGQNVLSVDTPLKVSATDGVLEIGTPGTDHIVAYSREAYNNTTGENQLIAIRFAAP